tara:strand:+ start:284 stop:424 length:141 start_codon:yes stop_codon:yes gene_type:complete
LQEKYILSKGALEDENDKLKSNKSVERNSIEEVKQEIQKVSIFEEP